MAANATEIETTASFKFIAIFFNQMTFKSELSKPKNKRYEVQK